MWPQAVRLSVRISVGTPIILWMWPQAVEAFGPDLCRDTDHPDISGSVLESLYVNAEKITKTYVRASSSWTCGPEFIPRLRSDEWHKMIAF
jgi:hypothetical protein